jgi:hypothetical protein
LLVCNINEKGNSGLGKRPYVYEFCRNVKWFPNGRRNGVVFHVFQAGFTASEKHEVGVLHFGKEDVVVIGNIEVYVVDTPPVIGAGKAETNTHIGLVGGIELAPIDGQPGKRAFDVFLDCWDKGVLVRTTGDTVALSPPLIIAKRHIDQIIGTLGDALKRAA